MHLCPSWKNAWKWDNRMLHLVVRYTKLTYKNMWVLFPTNDNTRWLRGRAFFRYSWKCLTVLCNDHFQPYLLSECTLQFLLWLKSYCPDPSSMRPHYQPLNSQWWAYHKDHCWYGSCNSVRLRQTWRNFTTKKQRCSHCTSHTFYHSTIKIISIKWVDRHWFLHLCVFTIPHLSSQDKDGHRGGYKKCEILLLSRVQN